MAFLKGQRDDGDRESHKGPAMIARLLTTELAQTQDTLGPTWYAQFRTLGIPDRVTFGVRPLIGVGRIVTHSSGLFEFHDDGDLAIIVAEGEPEVPGWAEVHDLIAFKAEDPDRWWLRRGQVDLLGTYNITPWRLSPLTIHDNPLSWLQAGADGICVVDWAIDPIARLVGTGHLEAETPALKRRLEGRIQEVALAGFNITVTEEARHAA